MNNTIKSYNCTCNSCGKRMRKRPYELRKGTPLFCSRECVSVNQSKIKYNEMCDKVGIDFKEWLIKQYWEKELPTREIANIAYGKPKNGPNIRNWMNKLDIPLRESGEAIALQWKNDPLRRIEQSFLAVEKMGAKTESRKKLIKKMQSEEYRTKQSIAKTGKRNGMWNPDISEEERQLSREKGRNMSGYSVFRWKVYGRDNFTCQKCGDDKGGNLVVHHIDSYKEHIEKRVDENNGITLCEICHKEYHKTYGISGANRKDFKEYLNKALVR